MNACRTPRIAVLCALWLATPGAVAAAQPARAPLKIDVPFVEPKTLEEFLTGLESDQTGYYVMWVAATNPRKVEAFLREAQKQALARPRALGGHPWASLVSSLFHAEAESLRGKPSAARAAVFAHALLYLQEWHDLTQVALKKAPGDKTLTETLLTLKADLARAAFEAGQLDAAREHAAETLAGNTDTKNWNYGNHVHEMNQILGRIALRQGKREEAKRALLAAGATPGSPQLGSFGPNFVLARELLVKGEKVTVIQYLDLVGRFWARHDPTRPDQRRGVEEKAALLAKWKDEIRADKIPTDAQWRKGQD